MNYRRHRLRIETERHTIEGVVQLPDVGFRSRTTDYLNAHDRDFIAVTDATVTPAAGGHPVDHDYVAVSARHIVFVAELESLGPVDPKRGIGASAAG